MLRVTASSNRTASCSILTLVQKSLWSGVVHAAGVLRATLEKLGLDCWVKLTGGKGLHVVVPFLPQYGWPEVYAFTRAVAESIVRERPDAFTFDFARAGR
jgi:DNA primase